MKQLSHCCLLGVSGGLAALGLTPSQAEEPAVAGRGSATYSDYGMLVTGALVQAAGTSRFRAIARGRTYVLSALGLALNIACKEPEEFTVFSDFWIEAADPSEHYFNFLLYWNAPLPPKARWLQ